ncbi:hypothetical protein CBA19CS11_30655 [Caballeronia novacaledonica]|uniref:hypothetical protein n=1 Tax=Caballeronia novacaledonica TaxID=1544861 RepID=UPI001EE21E3A|nr:hypothetical protein [Caballeronia novacaledonica]GJH13291.1 hypothetical protein CBA19CS11_30655 [Caballeronia novacaledonica]
MNAISLADALRIAINLLREAAESRVRPSGVEMDLGLAQLHADAAEILAISLVDLLDFE